MEADENGEDIRPVFSLATGVFQKIDAAHFIIAENEIIIIHHFQLYMFENFSLRLKRSFKQHLTVQGGYATGSGKKVFNRFKKDLSEFTADDDRKKRKKKKKRHICLQFSGVE